MIWKENHVKKERNRLMERKREREMGAGRGPWKYTRTIKKEWIRNKGTNSF